MNTRNMTKSASEQVFSIISDIKKNKDNPPTPAKTVETPTEEVSSTNLKKAKSAHNAMKGIPKSGRFWKSERERFSTVNKTKGLKQDFKKKTALRIELKRTKELAKQALEQLNEKRVQQKERRRENLKRAEENKRKSEIVQVITNSAKIKRMRKKQLRFIQKRDTNQQVEASK